MPRDLFAEEPNAQGEDLFQKHGIDIEPSQPDKSLYQKTVDTADDFNRAMQNLQVGAGHALGSGVTNAINLTGTKLPNVFGAPEKGAAGDIGEALGNIGGFLGGGEAIGSLAAIPKIANMLNHAKGILGTGKISNALTSDVAKYTTGGAAYGGVTAPEGKRGEEAILGGAAGL